MPAAEDRYASYQAKPPEEEAGIAGYASLPLAWLVPGLGHFLIGHRARGVVFAVTIHLLFALGMLLGGIRSIRPREQPIWTYTQYLAGWPMLAANHFWNGFAQEYLPPVNNPNQQTAKEREFDDEWRKFERNHPVPAGSDEELALRAEFTRRFIAKNPAFALHPKVHDIGSVYCGIAGMLNLLVIFDVLLRVTGSQREDPTAARRKKAQQQAQAGPAAKPAAGGSA